MAIVSGLINTGTTTLNSTTTVKGPIYFGSAVGSEAYKPILVYSETYPQYGICYNNSSVDKLTFSASGNAGSAGADLCINGNGNGTVTIRGNTIWHAGNLTNVSLLTNDAGYLTSLPSHNHHSDYMRVIEQNSTFTIDAIPSDLAPGVHKIHISGKEYSSILCGNDYTGAQWLLYFHPHASYDLSIKYRYRDGAWRTILDSNNSSVSKAGLTLTVTINGTSQELTNSTYNFSGASFTSGQSDTGDHNCNNIKTNGHWYYTSNGPDTSLGATTNDGALYTQAYSTSWVTQIAQDYRNGNLYTRSHKGDNSNSIPSGWLPWRKVAYIDDIPSNFLTEELDNLTTVTTRGNTTLNSISVGGLTSASTVYVKGASGHREGIRISPVGELSSIWFNATGTQDYTTGLMWGITAYTPAYTGDDSKLNTLRFRGPLQSNSTSATDLMWLDTGGNLSVRTGLKTGTVDLSGNLTLMVSNQHNSDLFIRFKYSTTDLDNYSWRIGYLGSGSGNENRLVFLSNGNGAWANVLTLGLTDYSAVFSGAVTLSKLSIPTTNGGTTYGLGTSGQILKTNGATVYWASDSDVTQTVTTSSNTSWRPIILGYSYSDAEAFAPTTTTASVYATHLIKVKPSTGDLCLYSASGDSPRLIFQRGTSTDSTYDWDIHVTNGTLKFRRNNSGTWTDALSLYVSGDKITTPWPIISSSSITADAGFSGNLTGNATSATKLQTARTLTIGSTGKTFDGSTDVAWSLAEIGAASSGHTHSFSDITPGTATIGDGANSIYLRTSSSWASAIYHQTSADESVVFLNKGKDVNSTANYTTSWIFAYGNPSDRPVWSTLTPALQIKGACVAINKLIGSKVGGAYNLDVNGTANITGDVSMSSDLVVDGKVTADGGFTGNLTGIATKAIQLATARTITLGTAVTATATSFNGTSNITIPVTKLYLGYLDWGGKSLSGEVSPIGCALSNEHNANRLAFLSANAIDITTSSNSGSSYSAYSITAANKQQLVTTSSSVNIGPTTVAVTGRTRILLGANGTGTSFSQQYVYTSPKKLLLNITTNGHGVSVLIEYATGAAPTSYTALGTYALSGWSGWNDIPLNGISRFGGSATQNTQVWYIRLTFMVTSVSASYANTPPLVLGIRMYGDNLWRAPSTMSQTGHLYSFDISQNATFPAKVNAASGFFQTSDESLKQVIRPISVDLDKLTKLRKVYFTWNELTEKRELLLGMIALDVQKLYPEIVNTDGDHLSLAYDKLSVIALKAIDELYKLIQDLLLENSKLKLQLNSLNK